MNNFLREMGKTFSKGIIFGLGILLVIGLAGVSYAAFSGFAGLNASVDETLTATKWNDMVDAVEEEYLTDGTEVLTSKTWDGKPVYRKVLSSTVNSDNGDTHNVLVHTDAEEIFVIDVYSYVPVWDSNITTAWQPVGYYFAGTSRYSDNNAKAYSNHSALIGQPCKIIVEYTKTTD